MIIEFSDADTLVQLLEANELKALAAKDNDGFRRLYHGASYQEPIRLSGNGKTVSVHLYPVVYSYTGKDSSFIEVRMAALRELFRRWDALGLNTKNEQNALVSKEFAKYLREAGFLSADWIMIRDPEGESC